MVLTGAHEVSKAGPAGGASVPGICCTVYTGAVQTHLLKWCLLVWPACLAMLVPRLAKLAAGLGFGRSLPVAQREQEHVEALQTQLIRYLERQAAAEQGCSGGGGGGPTGSTCGFSLEMRESTIPGAGRGVFFWGRCPAGSILTLYPGLVFDLETFLSLQAATAPCDDDAFAPVPPPWTVANHYLLHLPSLGTSFIIDGQPHGLSAHRFAAAARGEAAEAVNTSWLQRAEGSGRGSAGSPPPQPAGLQQAALGHMVNHGAPASTAFDLCPLPSLGMPPSLLRFVPSLNAGRSDPTSCRMVPLLLANAPLEASPGNPIELFADYGANPCTLGFQP